MYVGPVDGALGDLLYFCGGGLVDGTEEDLEYGVPYPAHHCQGVDVSRWIYVASSIPPGIINVLIYTFKLSRGGVCV